MKYLYLLLFFVSTVEAQVVSRFGSGVERNIRGGSGFSNSRNNYVVNLWQTFEFTNPTIVNLEANDNNAVGAWLTNDASLLITTSTTGENGLLSLVNGSSDSGHTRGLSKSHTANDFSYVQFDLGAGNTKANISVGSWFKFVGPTPNVAKRIFTFDYASGTVLNVDMLGTTKCVGFTSGANSNGVALVSGNFYWITAQINQNATSYVRVYDSTGTIVGSESTRTAANQAVRYVSLGSTVTETADNSIVVYWDDLVIDWTTFTYPLGP